MKRILILIVVFIGSMIYTSPSTPHYNEIMRTLKLNSPREVVQLDYQYYTSKKGKALFDELLLKYQYLINQAAYNQLIPLQTSRDSLIQIFYQTTDQSSKRDYIITPEEILLINKTIEQELNRIIPYEVRLKSSGFYTPTPKPDYRQAKVTLMQATKHQYFPIKQIQNKYYVLIATKDSILNVIFPLIKAKYHSGTETSQIITLCHQVDIMIKPDKVITPMEMRKFHKVFLQQERSRLLPIFKTYKTTLEIQQQLNYLADTTIALEPNRFSSTNLPLDNKHIEALDYVYTKTDKNDDKIIDQQEIQRILRRFQKKGKVK